MTRQRAIFLVGNLILLLMLLWSHASDLTATIRVERGTLTARLEGYTLQTSIPVAPPDGEETWVGLSWEEGLPTPTTPLARLQEWIASLFYHPYWGELTITPLGQEGETTPQRWPGPLWHASAAQDPAQGLSFATKSIEDYEIRASLGRGEGFARITVAGASPGNGYTFWFRPLHEDMGWQALGGGPLVSSGFRLSLPQAIKPVIRLLVGSYFVGLLIAGLFWVVKGGFGRLGRRGQALASSAPSSALGFSLSSNEAWLGVSVGLAALGAVLAAAWINSELLGRIPHVQDSVAYLFQAETFALGRLAVPSSPLPQFFEHEFIFNRGGLWFSIYSPGHPLVLALGVIAGNPWLVGPVMGGLFLVILFFLGRELYGARIGTLAVLLGLSSPFFLFMSASFMAHPTSLFFITAFMLAFVKLRNGAALKWGVVGGLALGLGFTTRQFTTLGLALPFVLVAIFDLATRWRWALPRYGLGLAGAAPPVLFLLWYNWQLTGSPLLNPLELWWNFDTMGFGPTVGMRGGHTPAEGFINTWRNLNALVVHLFGWPPYLALALLPLPFALRRARAGDWLLGAAFLSLVGAHVFYWADGIMYGPRYYYEALPALLLLSARGLQSLAEAGPWRGRPAAWAGLVLAGALLIGLVGLNLTQYLPQQLKVYRDYNYVGPQALETVRRAGLHQAVVFVEHEPTWQWWKYGAVFSANSPLLDTDVVYARDFGERNKELTPFFPGRTFYTIREGRLLPLKLLPEG